MREIKFRAWDKLNKEMINVESINFQERRVYKDTVSKNGNFRTEFEGYFDEYSFDLIDVVLDLCEINGNIYENSELMEEVR